MSTPLATPIPEPRAPSRRLFRGSAAVLAGLAANVVLGLGTDQLLHTLGVFPPWGQPMNDRLFLLATAYRVVYGVAGAYLTARLAPDRPMKHALALGAVGVLVSLVGAAATWNKGPEFGPKWYSLALVALALPCAWAGGALYRSRQGAR